MTGNLRKEIYNKSRFRNTFCKNVTKKNEKLCKNPRNKCAALRRKCRKEYFRNVIVNNTVTNKKN